MGEADYHKVPDTPVAYAAGTAVPAFAPAAPPNATAVNVPPEQKSAAAPAEGGCGPGGPTLGRKPVSIGCCPHCKTTNTRTRTRTHLHWKTWVAVGALAIVFWPLFWLPLVVDEMKETDHFCVSCGAKVGGIGPFEDCCVTTSE